MVKENVMKTEQPEPCMEVGPLRIEDRAPGAVCEVVRQAKSHDEPAGESRALGLEQTGGMSFVGYPGTR